jgi:cobalt/nickel transport system permease protein
MAVAVTFAVTLLPLPLPGIGVTSHMCATPVLALLLGPEVMAAPATIVLFLQALFFAHGGLTTLGANVFTLGVVGPWSAFLLAQLFRRLRLPGIWVVGLACGLADAVVYVVDAGLLSAAVAPPGETLQVCETVLLALLLPQGLLAILEGVVSAALFAALATRRRTLVPAWFSLERRHIPVIAPIAVLLLTCAGTAVADPLPGLDEAVFEATAARTGHPPHAPLLDLGGGEATAMLIAFFVMGLATGLAWEKIAAPRPTEGDRA